MASTPHVPRVVHQIWWQGEAAIPAKYAAPRATWLEHHPPASGWRIQTWDEDSIRGVLRAVAPDFGETPDGLVAAVDAIPTIIQRCDVARVFILYQYGGVYADMDTLALQPLDGLLAKAEAAVAAKGSRHAFIYCTMPNNAVFASSVRNPLLPRAWWPDVADALGPQARMGFFNRMAGRMSPGWRVLFTTGPMAWLRVLDRDMSDAQRVEWGVYRPPQVVFFPALHNSGRLNRMSPEDRARMAAGGSYCYHSQEGDWVERGLNIETVWLHLCQADSRRVMAVTLAAAALLIALVWAAVAAYRGGPGVGRATGTRMSTSTSAGASAGAGGGGRVVYS